MRRRLSFGLAAAAFLGVPALAGAQDAAESFLAVGEAAPDVSFTGATRHGVLANPVSLKDYLGETLVIAFFFRARSSG